MGFFDDIFGAKAAAAAKASATYSEAVRSLIADGDLSSSDTQTLSVVQAQMGIEDTKARAIYAAVAGEILEHRAALAIADGQLSPHEDLDLTDLAVALNVSPTYSEQINAALWRARNSYRLINLPLPIVASSVGLPANEACYYDGTAGAYETRTKTTSVTYGGPVLSVPILPGIRYRVGNVSARRATEEYRHSLGIGRVIVTNARLLFVSPERSITVPLSKILQLDPYSDGVIVTKASGKPLTIIVDAPHEGFPIILARAWDTSRGL